MDKHQAKNNMITQQLRTNSVFDLAVLDLFENIDREAFVPANYRAFAYADMQIPLPHQQQMLTPLEEALTLQSLQLQGHETILEIGTGTGFFTTLLSKQAHKVITVDFFPELTQRAQKNCAAFGCQNIEFVTALGNQGWVESAPYDGIVLSGALESLTDLLKLQVHLGGKLFAITGKDWVQSGCLYQIDSTGKWSQQLVFETHTPLLIDKQRHPTFVF